MRTGGGSAPSCHVVVEQPKTGPERHLKIDNTALEAAVVAERILEHFGLQLKAD